MFDKSTKYSYRAQKNKRYRVFRFFLIIFILYMIYTCITAFFFSVWVVKNNTMQPALASGDRLIFSSFKPPVFIDRRMGNDKLNNLIRGSIVLVDMGRNNEQKLPLRIVDGAVRFFTAQKISIFSQNRQYYIKRIIALPGDEISMTDYVFKVKSKGKQFSLTEFELSEKPYHPAIPQFSSIWDDSIPFSGNMEAVILGQDECFVISDDRSNTNDSRTWGAISPSLITARAVLRFWPLKNFESF
jgi:signal peptidase I